jgi:hypothetical protein
VSSAKIFAEPVTVEVDALAGVDLCLAVERQVIEVFRDQDVGHHRLGRQAAVDQARRRRRLHHGALASPAAIARPADYPHLKVCRHHVELFGHVLADHVQRAATARAGLLLRLDHHLLARQVLRQAATVAARRPTRRGRCRRAGLIRGRHRRLQRLLDVFQAKLQLVRVEAFGAPAVQRALELLDQQLQLVDLGLGCHHPRDQVVLGFAAQRRDLFHGRRLTGHRALGTAAN